MKTNTTYRGLTVSQDEGGSWVASDGNVQVVAGTKPELYALVDRRYPRDTRWSGLTGRKARGFSLMSWREGSQRKQHTAMRRAA